MPEVGVSKPEGDVGHVESLGLGLAVRALGEGLRGRLAVRLGGVLRLLGDTERTVDTSEGGESGAAGDKFSSQHPEDLRYKEEFLERRQIMGGGKLRPGGLHAVR